MKRTSTLREWNGRATPSLIHRTYFENVTPGRENLGADLPALSAGRPRSKAQSVVGARPRLLIVHPNRHVADVLTTILGTLRIDCEHAEGDSAAVRHVGQDFSLMLSVVEPSDPDALQLLAYSRRKQPWLPVLVVFSTPDESRAKEAMRLGALAVVNYRCPPAEMREAVSDALRATREELPYLAEPTEIPPAPDDPGPAQDEDRGQTPRSIAMSEPSPTAPHETPRIRTLKDDMEIHERFLLVRALQETDWNRNETARVLDINRTTLYHKMRKYDLF